jgi:hypothetical protein
MGDEMDPTFGHPLWIAYGALLVVGGFLLFRWARRLGAPGRAAAAQRDASVGKILKGQKASKPAGPGSFRRAMSQFFGIVGFLMILTGLMAIFLGIFYVGNT